MFVWVCAYVDVDVGGCLDQVWYYKWNARIKWWRINFCWFCLKKKRRESKNQNIQREYTKEEWKFIINSVDLCVAKVTNYELHYLNMRSKVSNFWLSLFSQICVFILLLNLSRPIAGMIVSTYKSRRPNIVYVRLQPSFLAFVLWSIQCDPRFSAWSATVILLLLHLIDLVQQKTQKWIKNWQLIENNNH